MKAPSERTATGSRVSLNFIRIYFYSINNIIGKKYFTCKTRSLSSARVAWKLASPNKDNVFTICEFRYGKSYVIWPPSLSFDLYNICVIKKGKTRYIHIRTFFTAIFFFHQRFHQICIRVSLVGIETRFGKLSGFSTVE